jgi:putative transposase
MSAVANVLNVLPWTNYDTSVLRVQGYKFEALPNGEQLRNLRRFAGSCRFVYNKALALNKQRYENKEKRLAYAGTCALLPSSKTAHPWLSDAPSQVLQQSLKDLERAYTNFFQKRADLPDFHRKGRKDSFPIPRIRSQQHQRAYLAAKGWLDALPQVTRHSGGHLWLSAKRAVKTLVRQISAQSAARTSLLHPPIPLHRRPRLLRKAWRRTSRVCCAMSLAG